MYCWRYYYFINNIFHDAYHWYHFIAHRFIMLLLVLQCHNWDGWWQIHVCDGISMPQWYYCLKFTASNTVPPKTFAWNQYVLSHSNCCCGSLLCNYNCYKIQLFFQSYSSSHYFPKYYYTTVITNGCPFRFLWF